jgi:hypothetical protein
MKIVRHVVVYLSLAASVSGCTFGPIAPNPNNPALSAGAPSFAEVGDFAWAAEIVQSIRR